MSPGVRHLLVGPREHGAVRLASAVALSVGGPVVEAATPAGVPNAPGAAHVHFTDRLFAPTVEQAADRFVALADCCGPLTVTLHDLPIADGSAREQRRAAAYARVVAAARAVVVNSECEADRLAGVAPGRPTVIPLPIEPYPATGRPQPDNQVVVLGFLWPGKGHAETLTALTGLPAGVGLTALGRASLGHEDLVEELAERATALNRSFRVTGFVPDEALPSALRAAAVPVSPNRQVSASASINTWLAAGRRPLVPDTAYAREIETRCPGALNRYIELGPALAAAYADPASTWLGPEVAVGPRLAEVAAAYAAFWETAFAAHPC